MATSDTLGYSIYIPFRITLFIGCLVTLLSISPTAHATFYDVSDDHPYVEAIDWLTRERIVTGYQDRSFQPQRNINRAEFTKIVVETLFPDEYIARCLTDMYGQDIEHPVLPTMSFPDVPAGIWFTPAVCTAFVNGIVSGYPDGWFRPDEGVNFVEAAKMLSIAFGLTGVELPNLGSQLNVVWYQPYVEFLAHQQAIPYSISQLDQPINRGEMAEMIYRLKDSPYQATATPQLSKTTEQVAHPVDWEDYTSYHYGFRFEYANVWPKPARVPRGRYDGRSPYTASSWTIYFGPASSNLCYGSGECIERDMWIDGYPLEQTDNIVQAVFSDEQFIELLDEPIINGLPALVVLEEVDGCIDKRGFLFGQQWIYVINFRCGGEDDRRFALFDELIRSFTEIHVPDHKRGHVE